VQVRVTEEELLAAIRKVAGADAPRVLVGIGDDAAVLEAGAGQLVLTSDMLVEGVHFERAWMSARDVGFKAASVNLSDLAAMAASPRHCLVSLGLPTPVDPAWVMEFFAGLQEACEEHGVSVVGGDLDRASAVVVSVTMTGEVSPGKAVLRSGALGGDAIAVTGFLGAAAGGLAVARASKRGVAGAPWARAVARAFARPTARVAEAQVLASAGAHAMMDISDGLASDLPRMCEASGVGAQLHTDELPVSEELRRGADTLGLDPIAVALSGGEDYELLVAIPSEALVAAAAELRERFGLPLTSVGRFTRARSVTVLGADDAERPLEPRGWDHFA
jgi:thiamine-monophosphate kinase